MKFTILLLIFITCCLYAESLTITQIIQKKQSGTSELKILEEIFNNELDISGTIDKAKKELQEANFSQDFIDLALEPVSNKGKTSCKIQISCEPANVGGFEIYPKPNSDGKIAKGATIVIKAKKANDKNSSDSKYFFDSWQGDIQSKRSIVRFKLERDLDIQALYRKVEEPTRKPKPIKDPEAFKDTRRAGYKYKGHVLANVTGKGESQNWGIIGQVHYQYIYEMSYTSTVVSNNGYQIKETRKFDRINEMLIPTQYEIKIDVKEHASLLKTIIGGVSAIAGVVSTPGTAAAISQVAVYVDIYASHVEKITLKEDQVKVVLGFLENMVGQEAIIDKMRDTLEKTAYGRILSSAPHMKYLEGKSFDIFYEDGAGITDVQAHGDEIVTAREKELIQRAYYLSDYYIFRDKKYPRRRLKVGSTWKVDARNVAGVLDPKLRNQANGEITLHRVENKTHNQKQVAVFNLIKGKVYTQPESGSNSIEAEVEFDKGTLLYDLQKNYVVDALLLGSGQYYNLSKDHWFYKAKLHTDPQIKISYTCTVEKQK